MESFDLVIRDLLENTYQSAMIIGEGTYSPEQIKMMIIVTNLESLIKTFLFSDLHPEVELDLKKISLGVMGCTDWIRESF